MEFEEFFINNQLIKLIRETVLSIFPEAQERISYGMPAWFNGKTVLIYAQPQKHHLGIYPRPNFIENHLEVLKQQYECSKGTIKVPYGIEHGELRKLVSDVINWNLTHFT